MLMAWCWAGRIWCRRRVDGDHLVALERALELLERGFGAFADLLGRGVLDGQAGFQAVGHGQQAFGEAFERELAGLGHSSSARRRAFSVSALARR
jgi:hypothetical protein